VSLRRIQASVGSELSPQTSNLASEAIRLPAGQRALNRQTTGATALIVAEGEVAIGTLDDNATLKAGEGVLLEPNAPYSLIAESDSLALLFSVPGEQSGASEV
jgi:quercetin dioxygenase-like cupin family protein